MISGKVLAATLLTQRKSDEVNLSLPAISRMFGISELYINIEENSPGSVELTPQLFRFPIHKESWWRSGWPDYTPQSDKDQRRLVGITTARNMAIDYALYTQAEWLLFIDSDVAPQPDGLLYLLNLKAKLCGGLVPGRGEHKHVHYIFAGETADKSWAQPIQTHRDHIECGFGTCGYMLIHASIFSQLRFRYNTFSLPGSDAMAEDPAYCYDAVRLGLIPYFKINPEATAQHGIVE